jgi:ribosomal-protein-serine acetyltransferase
MRIEPIRYHHARDLYEIVARDREYLRRWQNWPDHIRSLKDMRDLIHTSMQKSRRHYGADAVILCDGQVAGKVGLVYIDWDASIGEIGYWLAESFQRRGLITRATRYITGWALGAVGLGCIRIRCAAENVRSRAVPERLGFHFAGIQPQRIWIHGELHNDTLYTMAASDWYGMMIYHITTKAAWSRAGAEYRAESLAEQGFIHASTREQVERVANAVVAGQRDLVVLCLDPGRLQAELKYEPPDTSVPAEHYEGELFPHIYGPINTQAVVKVVPLPPTSDGRFTFPADLR